MQAVVMAGGEGSRLRPLTLNRPKPMVPIANNPVMGHILRLLKRHDIDDITATLQYRADDIQNYFGDGANWDVTMHYSVEPRPLGTAGSVKFAEPFLSRTDPFLIISGDALTDLNLSEIVAFHNRVGAAVTITLCRVPNPLEYGVIITDSAGRIENFLEKPSWGQVTSDTVNTGIYVISPEVMELIEPGEQCDFSKDLFPLLMQRGAPLFGYVAEGYWCDVGNIAEYIRATGDVLSGKVNVGKIGDNLRDEIYVEEDVEIAGDALLEGPIFLGRGTRIKSGVVIHGPTVVRPFSIIDDRAHIDRSIIWRNAYIGEDVELRGAIIGKRCNLRPHAVVWEGAVLGDECNVGERAVIHPNVKIWPNKQVDAGTNVKASLIWGAQAKKSLFTRFGVTGQVNIDLTPEFAARLSAAFGATLRKGSTVTINRDSHRAARMIKRAMVSGLPSAGIRVEDLEAVPIPVARFYTATSGAAGGVHVRISPFDQRVVDIRFFGEDGQNLGKTKERNIENIFGREDFRRVYLDDLGQIEEITGRAEQVYSEAFLGALDVELIRSANFKIVADYAASASALVLPKIFDALGVNALALNERIDETKMTLSKEAFDAGVDQVAAITPSIGASLGVRFDVGGERMWLVDAAGQKLSQTTAAAVFLDLILRDQPPGRSVAVMVNQSEIFDAICAQHDAAVRRVAIDPQALMSAMADPDVVLAFSGAGEFIVPSFHKLIDALYPIAKLLELLARYHVSLSEVAASLPTAFTATTRVDCPWNKKGTVMRLLNEQFKDQISERVDGVKVRLGVRAWVLFIPEPDQPTFTIYTESESQDAANDLVARYAALITGMQA